MKHYQSLLVFLVIFSSATAVSAQNDLLTVSDASGLELRFQTPPERIACLSAICLDILAELGLEPVAYRDNLAHKPEYFGERAESFIRIGGSFSEPSLEDIARAKPDLVLGWPAHEPLREALTPIAPLFVMTPRSYEDALAYLRMVGELTGRTDQAEQAAARFTETLAHYRALAPGDKTVLLMWGASGVPEFGIDSEKAMGGSLLAQIAQYPWPADGANEGGLIEPYALERVLEVDPDVIFVATFTFGDDGQLVDDLAMLPLWRELSAVKNGQVHPVDIGFWVTGQGTRALAKMLDEAMAILYPEVVTAQR